MNADDREAVLANYIKMWSPDSEINSIGMTIRHSISASSGELTDWLTDVDREIEKNN